MLRKLIDGWSARAAADRLQREGVVVLRGLLDAAALQAVDASLQQGWQDASLGLIASIPPDAINVPAQPALQAVPGIRLLDPHWSLDAVRDALLHPRVTACLATIYRTAPMLFQSQMFVTSPGAIWHRDDAYLALCPNHSLIAMWVALEDVVVAQGAVEYMPGSHRIPPYAFGGSRAWFTTPLDGADEHARFVAYLTDECARRGLQAKHFVARAGDAIVWDGRTVHRSVPVTGGAPSRRSLVAHYCSAAVTPRYLAEASGRLAAASVNAGRYATGYYLQQAA